MTPEEALSVLESSSANTSSALRFAAAQQLLAECFPTFTEQNEVDIPKPFEMPENSKLPPDDLKDIGPMPERKPAFATIKTSLPPKEETPPPSPEPEPKPEPTPPTEDARYGAFNIAAPAVATLPKSEDEDREEEQRPAGAMNAMLRFRMNKSSSKKLETSAGEDDGDGVESNDRPAARNRSLLRALVPGEKLKKQQPSLSPDSGDRAESNLESKTTPRIVPNRSFLRKLPSKTDTESPEKSTDENGTPSNFMRFARASITKQEDGDEETIGDKPAFVKLRSKTFLRQLPRVFSNLQAEPKTEDGEKANDQGDEKSSDAKSSINPGKALDFIKTKGQTLQRKSTAPASNSEQSAQNEPTISVSSGQAANVSTPTPAPAVVITEQSAVQSLAATKPDSEKSNDVKPLEALTKAEVVENKDAAIGDRPEITKVRSRTFLRQLPRVFSNLTPEPSTNDSEKPDKEIQSKNDQADVENKETTNGDKPEMPRLRSKTFLRQFPRVFSNLQTESKSTETSNPEEDESAQVKSSRNPGKALEFIKTKSQVLSRKSMSSPPTNNSQPADNTEPDSGEKDGSTDRPSPNRTILRHFRMPLSASKKNLAETEPPARTDKQEAADVASNEQAQTAVEPKKSENTAAESKQVVGDTGTKPVTPANSDSPTAQDGQMGARSKSELPGTSRPITQDTTKVVPETTAEKNNEDQDAFTKLKFKIAAKRRSLSMFPTEAQRKNLSQNAKDADSGFEGRASLPSDSKRPNTAAPKFKRVRNLLAGLRSRAKLNKNKQ